MSTSHLCPVCGSRSASEFWRASGVPKYCNVMYESAAEARAVDRVDITLAVCGECAFIWNVAFDDAAMGYDQQYENALHYSKRFEEYMEKLAAELIDRHALRDKVVLEIACGQGEFLALLCERGNNRGIGFDPSYRGNGGATNIGRGVTIVQDYFDGGNAGERADLVCCRHALEHIADPVAFLRAMTPGMNATAARIFFEVPNVMYSLEANGIWDIIYEHCNYFSEPSLRRCFERAGLCVLRTSEEYGLQFLTIEAESAAVGGDGTPDESRRTVESVVTAAKDFGRLFEARRDMWATRLKQWHASGKRVVLWGGGSKGVTMLNVMAGIGCAGAIGAVVDINPRKHGNVIAGVGCEIIPPERLRELMPDVIVVANSLYLEEIRGMAAEMELNPELVALDTAE